MKPLIIIPARAGSKGLKGKNWKLLNGKPLIQYSIEAAISLFPKEQICITTNSEEVIAIAKKLDINVPFVRPDILSTDEANSQDVLLHAVQYWEENYYHPDVVILLQPTSPFRQSKHIEGALLIYNSSIDIVVGVKETKANPYYILMEEDNNGFLVPSKKGNFTRRQDCPKVFEINGAIYIINPESLKTKSIQNFNKTIKFEMDEMSSHDIDDEMDWLIAEFILKYENNENNSKT
jgi:CMP-N,N'-diacetyllegionaminic acid synthase